MNVWGSAHDFFKSITMPQGQTDLLLWPNTGTFSLWHNSSPLLHLQCGLGPWPYVIAWLRAPPRVVWKKTTFFPTSHHELPCIPFQKPWFRLWLTLEILKHAHLLTPQWSVTIDLVIWDEASWSMTQLWHFRSMDRILPLRINDWDLLRESAFQNFNSQTTFPSKKNLRSWGSDDAWHFGFGWIRSTSRIALCEFQFSNHISL